MLSKVNIVLLFFILLSDSKLFSVTLSLILTLLFNMINMGFRSGNVVLHGITILSPTTALRWVLVSASTNKFVLAITNYSNARVRI